MKEIIYEEIKKLEKISEEHMNIYLEEKEDTLKSYELGFILGIKFAISDLKKLIGEE